MKKIVCVIAILSLVIMAFAIHAYAVETNTTLERVFENSVEYNGNRYLYVSGEYSWEQARLICEGLGGHLATITSQGEDDVCYQLFKNSGAKACWLGANDLNIEGRWRWVTGETWSFSNWGGEEPNGGTSENYLNYYDDYTTGRWNDCSDEDDRFPFICEWESHTVEAITSKYGFVVSSDIIYKDAFYYNGHMYKVFEYSMSSTEAKQYCENIGGHLATISSKEEDIAIFAYILKTGKTSCVLGGTDETTEGHWIWQNGEPFSYTNWNNGEPNDQNGEDYLQYSSTNGRWNDIKWQNCFLCEWDDCCILPSGEITEHDFGKAEEVTPPTCSSKGKNESECQGCGLIVTSEVDMLPHTYGEWIVENAATCHATGMRSRACVYCEHKETQSIDVLTHNWSEWKIATPASCFNSGTNERTCTLCGDVEKETVDQYTHLYGEYVTVSGSKLIPPIVKEKTCSLCGDVQQIKDWSFVWVPIVCGVVALFAAFGVVNYIKILKRGKIK